MTKKNRREEGITPDERKKKTFRGGISPQLCDKRKRQKIKETGESFLMKERQGANWRDIYSLLMQMMGPVFREGVRLDGREREFC